MTEEETTRDDLIEDAKSFGISESLLDGLNISSLEKIVEYEKQVRGLDVTEEI